MEPSEKFQVYATSDGCLAHFPENEPSKFKIRLNPPKVFSNPNNKMSVGLARLIYDSELYNLGENTGTFFNVFVENHYFKVEMGNAHVQSPASAKKEIEKAFDKIVVHKQSSDGKKQKTTLMDYISINIDKEKIVLELTGVHDFGISPMLRKLLGFHRDKKFFSENFEFRKQCREFLIEIAENNDFLEKMNELDELFDRTIFKNKTFEQRNESLIDFSLPIQQFYRQLNDDFAFVLHSIVKQRSTLFEKFLSDN